MWYFPLKMQLRKDTDACYITVKGNNAPRRDIAVALHQNDERAPKRALPD
jgi:hypothetical protein